MRPDALSRLQVIRTSPRWLATDRAARRSDIAALQPDHRTQGHVGAREAPGEDPSVQEVRPEKVRFPAPSMATPLRNWFCVLGGTMNCAGRTGVWAEAPWASRAAARRRTEEVCRLAITEIYIKMRGCAPPERRLLPSGAACPPKPHPRSLSTAWRGRAQRAPFSRFGKVVQLRSPSPLVERGPGGEDSKGRPHQPRGWTDLPVESKMPVVKPAPLLLLSILALLSRRLRRRHGSPGREGRAGRRRHPAEPGARRADASSPRPASPASTSSSWARISWTARGSPRA